MARLEASLAEKESEEMELHQKIEKLEVSNCLLISQAQQLHGYNVHVGEWIGQDQFHPR